LRYLTVLHSTLNIQQGTYFDSTLQTLSRWTENRVPILSIVQDPISPSSLEAVTRPAFAQPLVFHQLDSGMAQLLQSQMLVDSLTAFRLRIPSRPVFRSLCLPAAAQMHITEPRHRMPAIEILDLSTCGVLEGEVDMIIAQFNSLKHIILDDCPILRGEVHEGEWVSMGKRLALAGVRRAKEREKTIKVSLESLALPPTREGDSIAHRSSRGRRLPSTSGASVRDHTLGHSASILHSREPPRARFPKTRLLPPLPTLKTICVTVSPQISTDTHSSIRTEFEAGWSEGVAVLAVTRARLRESARHGVQIVRFAEPGSEAYYSEDRSENEDGEGPRLMDLPMMQGLEKVSKHDIDAFAVPASTDLAAPVLCFAGPSDVIEHQPGCGHSVAQTIWRD